MFFHCAPCQEGAEVFLPFVVSTMCVETIDANIIAVNALTIYGTPYGKITVNPNMLGKHFFDSVDLCMTAMPPRPKALWEATLSEPIGHTRSINCKGSITPTISMLTSLTKAPALGPVLPTFMHSKVCLGRWCSTQKQSASVSIESAALWSSSFCGLPWAFNRRVPGQKKTVIIDQNTKYLCTCGTLLEGPTALHQHLCIGRVNRDQYESRCNICMSAASLMFCFANWALHQHLCICQVNRDQYESRCNISMSVASPTFCFALVGLVPPRWDIKNINKYNNRMLIYNYALSGFRVNRKSATMTPILNNGHCTITVDNTGLGHRRGPAVPLPMDNNDLQRIHVVHQRGNQLQGHVVHAMRVGYVPLPPPQPLPNIYNVAVGGVAHHGGDDHRISPSPLENDEESF